MYVAQSARGNLRCVPGHQRKSRDGIAQGLQHAAILQTWNFQSGHGEHPPLRSPSGFAEKSPGDILPKTSQKRERFLQDVVTTTLHHTKRRCSTSQPGQTVPCQLKVNSWGVGSCGSSCVSQAPVGTVGARILRKSLISKISCKLRIPSIVVHIDWCFFHQLIH